MTIMYNVYVDFEGSLHLLTEGITETGILGAVP